MNIPLANLKGRSFIIAAIIYLPVIALLALTVSVSTYTKQPTSFFFRDPTATLNGHPLTGMLSNIGVLLWCASAAVNLFTSSILWRLLKDKTLPFFLFCLGVITFVLMMDDLFIFHDDLAYGYFGLNENIIIIGYGVVVTLFIAKFREIILSTDYSLMLAAGVFFALSVGIDVFQDDFESTWRIFVEDGFKLLGIVSWTGYSFQVCFHNLLLNSPQDKEISQ